MCASRLRPLLMLLMLNASPAALAASIQYSEDLSDFANPERGFYYQLESASNAPDPLGNYAPSLFAAARSTVVRRLYNLLDFRATPISTAFLQHIEADLGYARQNGLKLNIRFAYTFNEPPPNNDAPLALIQQHIGQLQPLLAANADVYKRFVEATALGWQEAMKDPEGSVKALLEVFPETGHSPENLLKSSKYSFASVCPAGSGDTIGVTSAETWAAMYDVMTTAMNLPSTKPVTDYYSLDYVPAEPVTCP